MSLNRNSVATPTDVLGQRGEASPVQQSAPARPSLRMLRPHIEGLPPLAPALAALPSGYQCRHYRHGDEAAWAALMNTGQMGEWDVARTRADLTGRPYPQFDPEGLFILTYGHDEQMVGSACAWLEHIDHPESGTLHMVCVLPAHRGQRLAYPLCLAVLHRHRTRGMRRVSLTTHEWRLGAIKQYLELGFRPVISHALHPEQWRGVVSALAWEGDMTPVGEPVVTTA